MRRGRLEARVTLLALSCAAAGFWMGAQGVRRVPCHPVTAEGLYPRPDMENADKTLGYDPRWWPGNKYQTLKVLEFKETPSRFHDGPGGGGAYCRWHIECTVCGLKQWQSEEFRTGDD